MYDRILVPTDGSSGVDNAVAYALALARRFDAAVEFLYVVDSRVDTPIVTESDLEITGVTSEKAGRHATAELVEVESDATVTREVRHGIPHQEILSAIDEGEFDLVVMGTYGATAAPIGSTTERVVTLSEVPVATVRAAAAVPTYGAVTDILVPIDGSDNADRAASHAIELAEQFGGTIHVVYVIDTSIYDLEDAPRSIIGLLRKGGETAMASIIADAEDVNVPSTGSVLRGLPTAEILSYADDADADLLVLGTRGRSGLPEYLLGSTTRRVIRDSNRPVLSIN
ncbi:MAG: universal stress protein [Halobacteriota archaeon]